MTSCSRANSCNQRISSARNQPVKMAAEKKKSSAFSAAEQLSLLHNFDDVKEIINCKSNTQFAKARRSEAWETIASRLNA